MLPLEVPYTGYDELLFRSLCSALDEQQRVILGRGSEGNPYQLILLLFLTFCFMSITAEIVRMSEEILTSQDKEEVSYFC